MKRFSIWVCAGVLSLGSLLSASPSMGQAPILVPSDYRVDLATVGATQRVDVTIFDLSSEIEPVQWVTDRPDLVEIAEPEGMSDGRVIDVTALSSSGTATVTGVLGDGSTTITVRLGAFLQIDVDSVLLRPYETYRAEVAWSSGAFPPGGIVDWRIQQSTGDVLRLIPDGTSVELVAGSEVGSAVVEAVYQPIGGPEQRAEVHVAVAELVPEAHLIEGDDMLATGSPTELVVTTEDLILYPGDYLLNRSLRDGVSGLLAKVLAVSNDKQGLRVTLGPSTLPEVFESYLMEYDGQPVALSSAFLQNAPRPGAAESLTKAGPATPKGWDCEFQYSGPSYSHALIGPQYSGDLMKITPRFKMSFTNRKVDEFLARFDTVNDVTIDLLTYTAGVEGSASGSCSIDLPRFNFLKIPVVHVTYLALGIAPVLNLEFGIDGEVNLEVSLGELKYASNGVYGFHYLKTRVPRWEALNYHLSDGWDFDLVPFESLTEILDASLTLSLGAGLEGTLLVGFDIWMTRVLTLKTLKASALGTAAFTFNSNTFLHKPDPEPHVAYVSPTFDFDGTIGLKLDFGLDDEGTISDLFGDELDGIRDIGFPIFEHTFDIAESPELDLSISPDRIKYRVGQPIDLSTQASPFDRAIPWIYKDYPTTFWTKIDGVPSWNAVDTATMGADGKVEGTWTPDEPGRHTIMSLSENLLFTPVGFPHRSTDKEIVVVDPLEVVLTADRLHWGGPTTINFAVQIDNKIHADWSCSIDYGDGTTGNCRDGVDWKSHHYDDGYFTATVTVTDGDDVATDSLNLAFGVYTINAEIQFYKTNGTEGSWAHCFVGPDQRSGSCSGVMVEDTGISFAELGTFFELKNFKEVERNIGNDMIIGASLEVTGWGYSDPNTQLVKVAIINTHRDFGHMLDQGETMMTIDYLKSRGMDYSLYDETQVLSGLAPITPNPLFRVFRKKSDPPDEGISASWSFANVQLQVRRFPKD